MAHIRGRRSAPPVQPGIERHRFSVASGALACLASVLGKVAFDGDMPVHLLARTSCDDNLPPWMPCSMVGRAVQCIAFGGMFMVNAVMFSTYLKALDRSSSTTTTVINCATSFLLSGVFGRILFGERLPALWFCGATFVVSGVMLIANSADDKRTVESEGHTSVDFSPMKTRSRTSFKRD